MPWDGRCSEGKKLNEYPRTYSCGRNVFSHAATPSRHGRCVATCLSFAIITTQGHSTQSGSGFAAGTRILNIEDIHFKHIFKLGGGGGGGGYWPKVKQRSKSRVVLLQCCRTLFEQGIARHLVL